MSMETITYQGYGVDLGNLPLKTANDHELFDSALSYIDEEIDASAFRGVEVAMPVNTTSFQMLMIIPTAQVVIDDPKTVRIYSKDEANKLIAESIISLFGQVAELIKTDKFSMTLKEVEEWVKENADYDYHKGWSDFI